MWCTLSDGSFCRSLRSRSSLYFLLNLNMLLIKTKKYWLSSFLNRGLGLITPNDPVYKVGRNEKIQQITYKSELHLFRPARAWSVRDGPCGYLHVKLSQMSHPQGYRYLLNNRNFRNFTLYIFRRCLKYILKLASLQLNMDNYRYLPVYQMILDTLFNCKYAWIIDVATNTELLIFKTYD